MSEKVRIKMDGHGKGRVYINDKEVESVIAVTFNAVSGEKNVLVLTLQPADVRIESPETVIQLPGHNGSKP